MTWLCVLICSPCGGAVLEIMELSEKEAWLEKLGHYWQAFEGHSLTLHLTQTLYVLVYQDVRSDCLTKPPP